MASLFGILSSPSFPRSGVHAGEVVEVVCRGPASPAGRGGLGRCGPLLVLWFKIWRRAAAFVPLAGHGGEGRAWAAHICSRSGRSAADRLGFLLPELASSSWCTVVETRRPVKLQWREATDGLVSSATSATSSVIELVFCLLLLLPSCYRGGRRRKLEEWLGLRRQLLLFLLFLELCSCGCACWKRPATRQSVWIGALLPPICLFAVCKILASALGGYCGDLNEVDSSIDPCRRLSCCGSSFPPAACWWRCMQRRIALFREARQDLVVFSFLARVLCVFWGQLIWMYIVVYFHL